MTKTDIEEAWRPVEGWPPYLVSNMGRVRRINAENPLKPGRDKDGYAKVSLLWLRKRGTLRICILVCRAFNGPRPTHKHQCAHDDGDNNNDRASNLFWKTCKENMADRDKHGWTQRGEKNFRAAFTNTEMVAVKAELAARKPLSQIASERCVTFQTIWRIQKGDTWKHVPGETGGPLTNRGERNGQVKLTEQQAREIKRLLAEGEMSQRRIAKLFGVSAGTVNDIARERTWSHL